jgi:hypothetical protein
VRESIAGPNMKNQPAGMSGNAAGLRPEARFENSQTEAPGVAVVENEVGDEKGRADLDPVEASRGEGERRLEFRLLAFFNRERRKRRSSPGSRRNRDQRPKFPS